MLKENFLRCKKQKFKFKKQNILKFRWKTFDSFEPQVSFCMIKFKSNWKVRPMTEFKIIRKKSFMSKSS